MYTQGMKQSYRRSILAAIAALLLLIYLGSWVVMPRLGKSLELNFDHGCDTGYFGLLDSQGSTCSSGGPDLIGFPFVIHPGPLGENALTIMIDVIPAAILFSFLVWPYRRRDP